MNGRIYDPLLGRFLSADVATFGQGGGLAVRAANVAIRAAKVVYKANDLKEAVETGASVVEAAASGDGRGLLKAAVEQVAGKKAGDALGALKKNDIDLPSSSKSSKLSKDAPKQESDKLSSSKGSGDAAKGGEKTYQTYNKPAKDPSKGGDYAGRTSGKGTPQQNVAKRDSKHHMNKTHGPAELDKSSSNSDAIRGREQQNIVANGGAKSKGGTSGNAISGILDTNKKGPRYIKAAEEEF